MTPRSRSDFRNAFSVSRSLTSLVRSSNSYSKNQHPLQRRLHALVTWLLGSSHLPHQGSQTQPPLQVVPVAIQYVENGSLGGLEARSGSAISVHGRGAHAGRLPAIPGWTIADYVHPVAGIVGPDRSAGSRQTETPLSIGRVSAAARLCTSPPCHDATRRHFSRPNLLAPPEPLVPGRGRMLRPRLPGARQRHMELRQHRKAQQRRSADLAGC